MLQTTLLEYQYGKRELRFPALRCEAGEALLITGSSGAGKTTLLHLLAGLLIPQAGAVRIGDTEITRLPAGALDRFRGRYTGIIYQQPHFIASLQVRDNLLLAGRLARKPVTDTAMKRITHALGIHHLLPQYPARLSQGEQQRVSIARALLLAPPLILADEPTASLDDHNCAAVAQLLAEQAGEQRAALVIVTHDSRLKEIFANRIHIGEA